MYTIPLETASQIEARQVGPKAWHLAQLIQQNIPVPRGFVIRAEALDLFLKENHLNERIGEAEFPQLLQQSLIPEGIKRELFKSYKRLQEWALPSSLSVAVRSSSAAEDLQEASFAGQYETYLNVHHFNEVLDRIKACWASLFSPRVRQYAMQKRVNLSSMPMGVLVQQMVSADVAGVIFSMNPVTRNTGEIIVNASYGLGEAVVSGLVTPDQFVVQKTTGTVQKELGFKEMKMISSPAGTETVETTEAEQQQFCLSDDQVHALTEETKRIESLYSTAVDIEFAIQDGKLYILQVRPITT
ncbi:PEP/pyruvate-binding domain-containing protein [Ammoniphilus resinae]|uniref:Phosphoenolpyruvate synthase n=1 Tax=Ammoniphilus resinae TaxID=861532 RepID=A0ABS4GPE6_9BACL|nr:pyruvate,water dikinase [Ammoniphilus resinae]